ncbi:DUF4129 domain-containing protein [Lysinibacter cavernae]|uniref:Type II secretory pathway pseudopilin PulG n=1 Tax=Lysinibacter cavernae TaxID=1640652 RepID=A0A7X5TT60_9MICO|nr:DUF4129 domain-containing protein [Lysinibacter cavernae]NIH53815.1 type II secretory pathway pseudopilin PulG [Lysinibacter cavernae]
MTGTATVLSLLLAVGNARPPGAVSAYPPLAPDSDEARDLLLRELSNPSYQAAKPSWFDLLSQQIWDWIRSLFDLDTSGGGWGALGQLLVVLVVIGLLVAAFFIFGMPRLRRRRRSAAGLLFGEEETRTAAELRAAAEAAASTNNWNLAVIERYRAIARSLTERVIIRATPGLTAQALAGAAAVEFPGHSQQLEYAARAFDGARYLDEQLSQSHYNDVASLDTALSSEKPLMTAAHDASVAAR